MSEIVCGLDGKYHVWIKIQDGTEPGGVFDTEEEAQAAWRRGEKSWNHNDFKASDKCAVLYEVRLVTTLFLTMQQLNSRTGPHQDQWKVTEVPPPIAGFLKADGSVRGTKEPGRVSRRRGSSSTPPGSSQATEPPVVRRIRREDLQPKSE